LRKTITKRAVDALKPGEVIADKELRGFVVRCLPSGRLSYGYRFTKDGRRRWLAIGVGIAPDVARKAAQGHAGQVAKDHDPLTEREQRRRKALAARTLNDILDAFVSDRVKGLRTEKELISLLNRLVRPKLGTRPIDAIKRLEIVELLDQIAADKSARTADKVLSVMGTCFRWHATRDDEFRSPIVPGMARLTLGDLTRDRILSDDEIRVLWSALDETTPDAYVRIVRTLLLSACRRKEIGGLQWPELEDDIAIIPGSRTKPKIEHVLPVTPDIAGQIGERPEDSGKFVFSTDDGYSPFSGYSKAKKRLDRIITQKRKELGLEPMPSWRLHDLRRTARSLMPRIGVSSDIAERVLGHVLPGVRGVYDRYEYLNEKRDALERLAGLLNNILNPPADNVVPLRAGK